MTSEERRLRIDAFRKSCRSIEEMEKIADKARVRAKLWTVEELDLGQRKAAELYQRMQQACIRPSC